MKKNCIKCKKNKYAIIGLGFIFPRHVEAIHKTGGKVILTCDIDPEKGADFLDYKEMLKSEKMKEVDTVVICTPNHLHRQMSIDALATGKQVLCEKPLILDNNFDGLEGVNSVLQLRYHGSLEEMKNTIVHNKKNYIEIEMKVCRDSDWWNLWRGDINKSGGPLFGLAIHMFDLLFVLFDCKFNIVYASNSEDKCSGVLRGKNVRIKYNVEIIPTSDGQTRNFTINNKKFELCNKQNLSFSGMHRFIYKDLINGKGIQLSDSKKVINLLDSIWNKDLCIIDNCRNKRTTNDGLCHKHHTQVKKHGKLLNHSKFDKNEFIEKDNYYNINIYSGLTEQKIKCIGKIDKKHYKQLKNYKWCLAAGGYLRTSVNNKQISMHHIVLGYPEKGFEVDHINGDKIDNRKENLRFVTTSQNQMNRKSNGYSYNKREKKWEAYIQNNKERIFLGRFKVKKDAIEARKNAEIEYFGEYRRTLKTKHL